MMYIKSTISICLLPILLSTVCKPRKEKNTTFQPVTDTSYILEKSGSIDPIASPKAQKGGVYTTWGGPYPKSLNYWLDSWHISAEIMGLLFDSLISIHSTQDKPIGALAQSWREEKDKEGRSFVFKLHPKAKWSDGKAITSADVQFYYDTIMNTKHRTTPSRAILSRFERPEILDEHSLRIRSKKRYWKAFWDAGFFRAFPKHIWEGKDFNRINFDFPVVNGPYKITSLKRNRYVLLKRQGNWWGHILKYNQHKFNFDYIRYRFMEDRSTALEAFKKGDFDVYPVYTSSLWVQQTKDLESVRQGWVIRQEIYNKEPKSFQGFAINLRRTKFQDIRVRRALCHLLDRELMNEKLMFNQYFLLNSYFPDLYPKNTNPKVKLCLYDSLQAQKLLKQAGWVIDKNDGIRRKNGKRLEVTFLTSMVDLRHINIYIEALKKAGIAAHIEQLSHATVTERSDNFKFDLYWMNTSASRLRDPESLLHSRLAEQIGSSNLSGLKDTQVDTLLDQLLTQENLSQRNALFRKLDLRLNALQPYVLLWQADKTRLLYWNRFGTPQYVLDKFSRENSAIIYWWLDPIKNKQLEKSRESNQSIKHKIPEKIYYPSYG